MSFNKPPTKLQTHLIKAALLSTWQTAAAIGQHAGVPAKTATAVLKGKSEEWRLESRQACIDGHNTIWLFRQRIMVQVLGVSMPQPDFRETET